MWINTAFASRIIRVEVLNVSCRPGHVIECWLWRISGSAARRLTANCSANSPRRISAAGSFTATETPKTRHRRARWWVNLGTGTICSICQEASMVLHTCCWRCRSVIRRASCIVPWDNVVFTAAWNRRAGMNTCLQINTDRYSGGEISREAKRWSHNTALRIGVRPTQMLPGS